MKMNNNLDELQEQSLLKIEHNGCWMAFWGLLVAIAVQTAFLKAGFAQLAGEWIVFMALSAYLCGACLREGIWDRNLVPDTKTNVLISVIAGIAFGVIMFFKVSSYGPDMRMAAVISALASAVMVFGGCMVALYFTANAYRKRRAELDAEPEE